MTNDEHSLTERVRTLESNWTLVKGMIWGGGTIAALLTASVLWAFSNARSAQNVAESAQDMASNAKEAVLEAKEQALQLIEQVKNEAIQAIQAEETRVEASVAEKARTKVEASVIEAQRRLDVAKEEAVKTLNAKIAKFSRDPNFESLDVKKLTVGGRFEFGLRDGKHLQISGPGSDVYLIARAVGLYRQTSDKLPKVSLWSEVDGGGSLALVSGAGQERVKLSAWGEDGQMILKDKQGQPKK